MKKLLITSIAITIALTSNISASDTDALTKAVVKIIKSQYTINSRLSKLEKNQFSKTSKTKASSSEINSLKQEIYRLNKRLENVEKNKSKVVYKTKKRKSSSKRRTNDDKIIDAFLK
jgi:predicted  nucleic acid-binding Zn-ribbon protein